MVTLLKVVQAGAFNDSLYIFRVFDLITDRIWKNNEHMNCSWQIYLSKMGTISEFLRRNLKLWSLKIGPKFWPELKTEQVLSLSFLSWLNILEKIILSGN